ncbi:phosphoribosylanthranilate isomerase [Tepidibacter sp. Z1-5]|uniref:phosphoribosylanthranilate isomerase n=1 Tax=Tepidibacter sp. Z1-5 TaxID=3134138 RepID=UPI0030C1D553
MTKVKICGLKREEDILYVNELQPDYVGFVFTKSIRQIDKYKAKELIDILDKNIKKVGVFLNNSFEEVNEIAKYCDLDILQFHGDESPMYCNRFDYEIWKAFRIRDETSLKELESYPVKGFLLDTFVKGQYGGTGKIFNWDIVSDINKDKFVILAGGLKCENIKKAIKTIKPHVVDLSSGVEVNGVKNFEKIKKIIESVRG